MPSDRQLAANSANARKSRGPRSASGKKRASRNALKHGLNTPMSGVAFARDVETLARQIADHAEDPLQMAVARDAAEAQLELARVQRVGVALVERIAAFGRVEKRKLFRSIRDETAWMALTCLGARLGNIQPKCAIDPLPPMPEHEPQQRRAAARRDRAVRRLAQSEDYVIYTTYSKSSSGPGKRTAREAASVCVQGAVEVPFLQIEPNFLN